MRGPEEPRELRPLDADRLREFEYVHPEDRGTRHPGSKPPRRKFTPADARKRAKLARRKNRR